MGEGIYSAFKGSTRLLTPHQSSTTTSPIGLSSLKSLIPTCNYFSRPATVQYAWTPHIPDPISPVILGEEYNPSLHLLCPHVTFSFLRYNILIKPFPSRDLKITLSMPTPWTAQVSYSYSKTNTITNVRLFCFSFLARKCELKYLDWMIVCYDADEIIYLD